MSVGGVGGVGGQDASLGPGRGRGFRDVIILFAKLPVPGEVKTRLHPPFTLAEAADFYSAMLDDALVETARIAGQLELAAVLSVHPGDACGQFADRIGRLNDLNSTRFEVIPQRGENLAQRMEWGVAEAAGRGARKVLLRGSDCPVLDDQLVNEALSALDDFDVALSPDCGGGYGLIGLGAPAPELFRLEMSTPRVAEETQARARALGLKTCELSPSFDVNTAQDLVQLAEARERGQARACPRTLTFLDARGLWPE